MQGTARGGTAGCSGTKSVARRRDMGLGPYPEIGLADAREKARDGRRLIKRDRKDPIRGACPGPDQDIQKGGGGLPREAFRASRPIHPAGYSARALLILEEEPRRPPPAT